MQQLISDLLSLTPNVRYVAVYKDGHLASQERPGLTNSSASESDKYEELLVNPTILTLATQRGNIDCGGLQYVILRYGNFFQLVHPIDGGHVSLAIDPSIDIVKVMPNLQMILRRYQLTTL